MPFSESAKNLMLDALDITQVSLHSGDPGVDGSSNEITGGSPAYARQNITHAAAATSSRDSTNAPAFDVNGVTISYVGYWAGATFRGSKAVTTPEVFAGQGVYNLTDSDLNLNDV
ncbi:MAG: hypothetical protein GY818_18935 [Planctomycetaceae bacterium]|nr:hypothetical protein [Planctomycetaceae bacterium]